LARISKSEHARILQLADEEGRKPAEIAAEYGCTPANIYALLSRLRKAANPAPVLPLAEPPPKPSPVPAADDQAEDETLPPSPAPATAPVPAVPEPPPPPPPPQLPRAPAPAVDTPPPAPVGARLAKPGVGLVTRTAEGEETLSPFRSLDDLLSVIKPLLRTAARSPDPIWFSIQPIDLSTLDLDA